MKAEEYADNYMEKNNIDPENFEYIHLLDLMEQYAYEQAMKYEAWLCDNGYTKTISARPDYCDFKEQEEPPKMPETKPHEKGWPDIKEQEKQC